MSRIAVNLEEVKNRIAAAARRSGRAPEAVKLVAVSKTVGVPGIIEALEAGVTGIGENRIQEAKLKYPQLAGRKITWHMIGHLQTNKVRDAVRIFDLIHSVDSLRLAEEINNEAKKNNKKVSCLIEINSGSESSKYGMKFEDAAGFIRAAAGLGNVSFEGLMTVAPLMPAPEAVRPFFKRMKELFEQLKVPAAGVSSNLDLKHLSMGMSQDYETAIEEGATMVRVGSAIFGKRN